MRNAIYGGNLKVVEWLQNGIELVSENLKHAIQYDHHEIIYLLEQGVEWA